MSSTIVEKSLYEQLGGSENIEAVVNYFYQRILNDKELRPIFDDVNMEQLRMHQTKFVSFALGGPNQYSGRGMRAAGTTTATPCEAPVAWIRLQTHSTRPCPWTSLTRLHGRISV